MHVGRNACGAISVGRDVCRARLQSEEMFGETYVGRHYPEAKCVSGETHVGRDVRRAKQQSLVEMSVERNVCLAKSRSGEIHVPRDVCIGGGARRARCMSGNMSVNQDDHRARCMSGETNVEREMSVG